MNRGADTAAALPPSKVGTKSSISGQSSYLKVMSKHSKNVDIAELKLKYEEQLEEKNQRIQKLESKNQAYLDVIAQREMEAKIDYSRGESSNISAIQISEAY